MPVSLRPYQQDLADAIRAAFRRDRRVLAVSPTGSGKTRIFSNIAESAGAKGNPVVIVAHRIEIVDQISDGLTEFGIRHGRIMQGHTMTSDIIQCGMIQTLARRLDRVPEPKLLVVDEAHHAVAGTWETVASAWAGARHLGVTATPQRLDGRGLGNAFDSMVLGPSVSTLIGGGFLSGFDYLAPPQQADFSSITTRAGDFAVDEVEAAMDKATITGDAVSHYQQHLGGRPAIVFCVTVAHAEHVAEQFRAAGIRAASVDGSMDKTLRRNRIKGLGNGQIQVLTSCDIISEGTDIPVVAGAILLRPTKSLSMFLQQVGRVLRPKKDGSRAVILDHVGNVTRHGLPDTDREWTLDTKKRKDPAPSVTQCKCGRALNSATAREDAAGCTKRDPCLMLAPPAVKPPAEIEIVAGELQKVTADDLAHLREGKVNQMLRGDETMDELLLIAKARGYNPRWALHLIKERRRKRKPAA